MDIYNIYNGYKGFRINLFHLICFDRENYYYSIDCDQYIHSK